MENYKDDFKIKTILTALYQDMESNRKMINMLWQELDKTAKPAEPVQQSSKMSQGDAAIVRVLSSRLYPVSLRTIAKETGLAPKTCSMGLWRLRKAGYDIQTSYDRSRQGKYLLRRAG